MLRFLWLCFFLGLGSSTWIKPTPAPTCQGSPYQANWASLDCRPIPDWYDKAKFGIILHWGVYSVPSHGNYGSEMFWSYWKQWYKWDYTELMRKAQRPGFPYQELAHSFTAEFFDPAAWALLFKASGARYVILTAKHHEGFTLWPSRYSWNWNARDLGPRRDLLGDLAASIRQWTDLVFGVGFSLLEWFNPIYIKDKGTSWVSKNFVKKKVMPQLQELVNTYRPHVLWSVGDSEAPDTYWNSTGFLAWLYNKSPVRDVVVVNDHWGWYTPCKHGGYYSCKTTYNAAYYRNHKWENAVKLEKVSYGYRRNAKFTDYLKPEEMIKALVETVSRGGNLLLNIGPTADGRILSIFEERLRQMGTWLRLNGQAIYGSQPWNYAADISTPSVWYTKNVETNSLYIIMLSWPKDKLYLGSLKPAAGAVIYMIGAPTKTFSYTGYGAGSVLTVPSLSPSERPCQYAWVLRTTIP